MALFMKQLAALLALSLALVSLLISSGSGIALALELPDIGVEVSAALPGGSGPYAPGAPVTVMCGVINGGEEIVSAKEIRALLSSPDDFSITIKNFTSLLLSEKASVIVPGSEVTFPYTVDFARAKNMRLRLTVELVTEVLGEKHVVTVHNGTVSWNDSSMFDSANGIISMVSTVGVLGGLGFVMYNVFLAGSSKKKQR